MNPKKMTRVSPSSVFVLLVLCTAGIRNCAAVRFESLEELLRYYEQQQNPKPDNRQDETDDELIAVTTTTETPQSSPPLRPDFNHRVHPHYNNHGTDQEEDGSGQETFLGAAEEPTTTEMVPTTTTVALETEVPTTTRRMTTCCHLGEMAGRRRDHCNPANYMPSIHRNRNRDNNFRKTNTRPSQSKNQRDKCVSGVVLRLAQEFQTCCEEAYKRMLQQEHGEEYNQNDRTHILEIPFF